jgi:hypothetical protein
MMALSGEELSEEAKERIRKLVNNHAYLQKIHEKIEQLQEENLQLREQVSVNIRFLIF